MAIWFLLLDPKIQDALVGPVVMFHYLVTLQKYRVIIFQNRSDKVLVNEVEYCK